MRFLYSVGISVYHASIELAALFSSKAKLWVQGRKGIFEQLGKKLADVDNIVWFHCASLGEFEQGRPLIEAYKKNFPHHKILLTFFSPSGFEVRKTYEGADYIFYLPVDSAKNAFRFVSLVNPKMVFFIKYEFWFNYLNEIKNRRIPCFLISGIFREEQLFFKPYGKWPLSQLSAFTHFFLQNNKSAELLSKQGFDNYSIVGDTRFDRVIQIADHAKKLLLIKSFCGGEVKVVIFGSSWPEEDRIALQLLKSGDFKGKIIIAPHEISNSKIQFLLNSFGGQGILWSELEMKLSNPENYKVLIIDTIGLLSSIYQYADIAVIGGGFGKGVHNVLEAATFGLPLFFGPNYLKFNEVKELIAMGAAESASSPEKLLVSIVKLLHNNEKYFRRARLAEEYVRENAGATEKILAKIEIF